MTGKTLKTWVVLSFAVFLTTSVYAEIADRIVAIVNDEVITMFDLNSALESYRKKIEESYTSRDKDSVVAEAKVAMLNKLIDGHLIEQEAKKAGIVVKDEEVMETIKDILGKRNIKIGDFTEILVREGSSFDAYRKEIRDQMTRMRLIRRELRPKVRVSEDEIGEYYRKHREDYEGREAVRVKQIFIPIPKDCDQEMRARLRANAEMIRKQINTAESFDLVAATYATGPAAAIGGDTGFVERGMMIPAVEEVAFSLGKDGISDIIESPMGFHIIRVVDKRGGGIKPLESVREEIKEKIEDEKMDKKYEEWIGELRAKSHIEIKL
ncbi:MAG: SurA N-terminal domain-containing protein [Syntrophales bacterium]|nr:SurA N-terminal domain-containing protein [Syntrophales bacterium]